MSSANAALVSPRAVWGSIAGTLSSQTELQAALNAKEPANAVEVVSGTTRTIAAADANKTLVFTNTGAITVTLPVAASGISLSLLWLDATGTITLVTDNTTVNAQTGDLVLSAARGSIVLTPVTGSPNTWTAMGAIGELVADDISDATASGKTMLLAADAAAQRTAMSAAARSQTFQISFYVPTVADGDVIVIPMEAFAGTLTKLTTDSNSGTCTLTGKINATALGGAANSVSTTKQSQNHATANVWAIGDDLVFAASANAACLGMRVTATYTRVSA